MFLTKLLPLTIALVATTACAGAQPPAPVVTVAPKLVESDRKPPQVIAISRQPTTEAQLQEARRALEKIFPRSTVNTKKAGGGAINIVVIPK